MEQQARPQGSGSVRFITLFRPLLCKFKLSRIKALKTGAQPPFPHSSTLAWKIPWTEEPGRLQSMGSLESDRTEQLHFHFSLACIGEGNGNPLQCSCLENPRDRGAWWAAVCGVAQSRTRLKRLSSSSSSHPLLSDVILFRLPPPSSKHHLTQGGWGLKTLGHPASPESPTSQPLSPTKSGHSCPAAPQAGQGVSNGGVPARH